MQHSTYFFVVSVHVTSEWYVSCSSWLSIGGMIIVWCGELLFKTISWCGPNFGESGFIFAAIFPSHDARIFASTASPLLRKTLLCQFRTDTCVTVVYCRTGNSSD